MKRKSSRFLIASLYKTLHCGLVRDKDKILSLIFIYCSGEDGMADIDNDHVSIRTYSYQTVFLDYSKNIIN